MPAPTLAAQGAHAAVTTGSVTPVLPAHQTNDILVVSVNAWVPGTTLAANQIPTPAGWALVRAQRPRTINLAEDGWHAIFWKRAASSAEANPVFTRAADWDDGPDSSYAARAYVVRGCITTGDPWDSTGDSISTASGSANVAVPALTVSGTERTAIHFYTSHDDNAAGTVTGWTAGTATTSTTGTDSGFQTQRKVDISANTTADASTAAAPAQGNHGFFGVAFTPAPTTTYTKAGQGFVVYTARGVVNRQNIDKTGLAVMGVAGAVSHVKAGAASVDVFASGTDSFQTSETGAGVAAFVASGPKAGDIVKTGGSQLAAVASGSDAVTTADAGTGVVGASGSGTSSLAAIHTKTGLAVMGQAGKTFAKAGAAAAGFVGGGTDAMSFTKAGGGAGGMAVPVGVFTLAFPVGFEASGPATVASTLPVTYDKDGIATAEMVGSGPRVVDQDFQKAGGGTSTFTAAGRDIFELAESGAGVVAASGSGVGELNATGTTYSKANTAVATFAAGGIRNALTSHAGMGVAGFSGSGSRGGGVWVRAGSGVSGRSGGGAVTVINVGTTHVKAGAGVTSLAAAAVRRVVYTENGSGNTALVASGTRSGVFNLRGTGVLVFTASSVLTFDAFIAKVPPIEASRSVVPVEGHGTSRIVEADSTVVLIGG